MTESSNLNVSLKIKQMYTYSNTFHNGLTSQNKHLLCHNAIIKPLLQTNMSQNSTFKKKALFHSMT